MQTGDFSIAHKLLEMEKKKATALHTSNNVHSQGSGLGESHAKTEKV